MLAVLHVCALCVSHVGVCGVCVMEGGGARAPWAPPPPLDPPLCSDPTLRGHARSRSSYGVAAKNICVNACAL